MHGIFHVASPGSKAKRPAHPRRDRTPRTTRGPALRAIAAIPLSNIHNRQVPFPSRHRRPCRGCHAAGHSAPECAVI
ncbi:hypothetical protein OCGS_0979 [Oceaniovalibus guishaninsula JLT2003]|uniref:Uncharacterized protein n=1 Tax=Oceaniovalibus guishaninsula JLT2003 TaxID=1231392 RepID=K2HQ35_9RHOB|nr:hypothetical protein OCGS_0979 [Oceaniovalibus guishaninsula JLT2003]